MRQTVTALELLDDWQMIIHQEQDRASVIGINDPGVYRQPTPEHRTPSKDLAIPAGGNLNGHLQVDLLLCLGSEDVVRRKREVKARIGRMGFLGQQRTWGEWGNEDRKRGMAFWHDLILRCAA